MRIFKSLFVQLLVVSALGVLIGSIIWDHRSTEAEWHDTHFRFNQSMSFPMSKPLPFAKQWLLDADGERHDLPLDDTISIDYGAATWWRVDPGGQTRYWNEERVEVFPTVTRSL